MSPMKREQKERKVSVYDANDLHFVPIERRDGELLLRIGKLSEASTVAVDSFLDAIGSQIASRNAWDTEIQQAWKTHCKKCGRIFFFGVTGFLHDNFSEPHPEVCESCNPERDTIAKYPRIGKYLTFKKAKKYMGTCKECGVLYFYTQRYPKLCEKCYQSQRRKAR